MQTLNWSLELFYALGETARYQRNHAFFLLSVGCLPALCCFFNPEKFFFPLFWFLRIGLMSSCQSRAVLVQDNSHLRRVKNWTAQPQWRQSPAFDIPAAEQQRGFSIQLHIIHYTLYIFIHYILQSIAIYYNLLQSIALENNIWHYDTILLHNIMTYYDMDTITYNNSLASCHVMTPSNSLEQPWL